MAGAHRSLDDRGERRAMRSFTTGNRLITKRPAPTRDRILDAAVELFGRQGYHGTSVGEIEEAAGLTPRLRRALQALPEQGRPLLEAAMEGRSRVVDELECADHGDAAGRRARGAARAGAASRSARSAATRSCLRIVMREGDNFPELRDRFHDRIVRRGHAQTAERLRPAGRARGRGGPRRSTRWPRCCSHRSSATASLETLFGRPPGDVDEDRYLDTWTRSP